MKRLILRLSIVLLTFLIGLGGSSVLTLFTQLPNIEVDYELSKTFAKKNKTEEITGEIEIKYFLSLIEEGWLSGQFKVTNRMNKSIYYTGANKNHHFDDSWIYQDGKVQQSIKGLFCCIVEQQQLKPNESAFFSIPVPQNKKPFEAGFFFKIGDERKGTTVWTKVTKQIRRKYGQVNIKSLENAPF